MYEAKQKQATQSSSKNQTREESEAIKEHPYQETQIQQSFRIRQIPHPTIQAKRLSQIPAHQIASNPQLLLQMQRQYGNRYVNQVLQQLSENKSPTSDSRLIQTKLTLGAIGDRYEQEADEIAAKVVKQVNAPITNQGENSIQRELEEEEETLQRKPLVQMSPGNVSAEGSEVSDQLEASIQEAKGHGQPLDAELQKSMGQAMGADFRGVKIHADAASDQLNRSIQAKAFTTGSDVFFRQGAYQPGSQGGQELIAHELTHVVQQSQSGNSQTIQRDNDLVPSRCKSTDVDNPWKEINDQLQIDWSKWNMKRVSTIFQNSISKLGDRSKRNEEAVATYDGIRKGGPRDGDVEQTAYGHLGEIEALIAGTSPVANGNFEGGHLCSDKGLGDNSYQPYNFAPQRSMMNNPDYRKIEEMAEVGTEYNGLTKPKPKRPNWEMKVTLTYPSGGTYQIDTAKVLTNLAIPSTVIKAKPIPSQLTLTARVPIQWKAELDSNDKDWKFSHQSLIDTARSSGAGARYLNSEKDVENEAVNYDRYLGHVRWSMDSMTEAIPGIPTLKGTEKKSRHTWTGIQDAPRGQTTPSPGISPGSIKPATTVRPVPILKLKPGISFSGIARLNSKGYKKSWEDLAKELHDENLDAGFEKADYTAALTRIGMDKEYREKRKRVTKEDEALKLVASLRAGTAEKKQKTVTVMQAILQSLPNTKRTNPYREESESEDEAEMIKDTEGEEDIEDVESMTEGEEDVEDVEGMTE